MVASFSNFYGKTWVGFCFNIRKRFFIEFSFLSQQKEHLGSSKNGTRDFQNSPLFERWACFYVLISESFKRFQYFDFETNFLETKTLFKKLEYRFLVETTEIEITSFPFKTPLSETNVKTNRMATIKWTYHKAWSFASNCFIFLEILFQF